jgi:hypothetical protein
MAAPDRLIYPASPAWRGPEMVLLNSVVSVFAGSFGVVGIVAVVGGLVSGSAAPVLFGIFWSVIYGFIGRTYLHLASRLEFADGVLAWRCSLPWSPRMRPGRVRAFRWPASSRSRYAGIELDDGRKLLVLPRPGLMEFIDGVRDADPAIVVEVRTGNRWSQRMSVEPMGYVRQRLVASGASRRFRISLSVLVSLVLLGVLAELSLTLIGPQENFQTLRSDLAKVHLPSGYRLISTRQAGTDCAHEQCSLTQTWAWMPTSGRTSNAACTDVQHAMISAFSGVDSNAPMPASASCDYYAILGDLLHPGQGKRTIEAIVRTGQAQANDRFLIEVTASYG